MNSLVNKVEGDYRGVVLKHLPHGKCKVYIPGIYDESLSASPDSLPTAEQETPLFAGTNKGNGVFSYPNLNSKVWCSFMNGDVNFPVIKAATLGGENAFGQYEIIKHHDEDVSERHLITSGKTRQLWFEKGILSTIVEDPIRTHCSVDFDQYEKERNNTDCEDKYSYEISNEIVRKVNNDEISNINCQIVLDNNGGDEIYGALSASTHHYDLVDVQNEEEIRRGMLSTDNCFIMQNDSLIELGTLSTTSMFTQTADGSETSDKKTYEDHRLSYMNPGILSSLVEHDVSAVNSGSSGSSNKTINQHSNVVHEADGGYKFFGKSKKKEETIDNDSGKIVNLTSNLENLCKLDSKCALYLQTELSTHVLSSDSSAGENYTEKGVRRAYLSADKSCDLDLVTFADVKINKNDTHDFLDLKNSLKFDSNGGVKLGMNLSVDVEDSVRKTKGKKHVLFEGTKDGDCSIDGFKHEKRTIGQSSTEVDNKGTISFTNDLDATMAFQTTSKKKLNDSLTVDSKFSNVINLTTSTADIQLIDNIQDNHITNLSDAKNGFLKIVIKSKKNDTSCVMKFDVDGHMTLVTSKSVTVESEDVTIKGKTRIEGPLHVTKDTTIDGDAKIGGISFLKHTHVCRGDGANTTKPN